jgi:hypothetical protein
MPSTFTETLKRLELPTDIIGTTLELHFDLPELYGNDPDAEAALCLVTGVHTRKMLSSYYDGFPPTMVNLSLSLAPTYVYGYEVVRLHEQMSKWTVELQRRGWRGLFSRPIEKDVRVSVYDPRARQLAVA